MAPHEALANAIVHGNHEDSRKCVYVACRCSTDGEVSITVRDEGRGFDTNTLADPTTAENRRLTHGRGIYLMSVDGRGSLRARRRSCVHAQGV
jgi:serine/threonine-protein kinase RsbW